MLIVMGGYVNYGRFSIVIMSRMYVIVWVVRVRVVFVVIDFVVVVLRVGVVVVMCVFFG